MRLKDVHVAVWIFVVWVVSGLVMAYAQNVSLYKREGAIPEVVNIKASMSDSARICIEIPGGGLAQCRSIGELRKWVKGQQAK